MEQLGEWEEISNNFESEEGSSNPKDRPRELSDVSRMVADIMSLREEPERMKTELEHVLGGLINKNSTPEKPRVPCTMNRVLVEKTWRFRLQFIDKLSSPVLTGKYIQGEQGNTIRFALVDITGQVIDYDPVAWGNVEIRVLEKNYNGTTNRMTEERNVALLGGNVHRTLESGVGILDRIKFKHTKRWMKKQEYRLGARMLGHFPGIQVEEAVTEPFIVEDQRAKLYDKSRIPSLSDKVWRLKGIGKDGAFHERLRNENIDTVKDFFTLLKKSPRRLAGILKVSTACNIWEVIVRHASTCQPREGQSKGLLMEHQFASSDQLSTSQKADAQKLVVSAYQQWREVVPVDDVSSDNAWIAGYQQLHNPLRITSCNLPDEPGGCNFENGSTRQETPLAGAISDGVFDLPDIVNLEGTTVHPGIGEAGLGTLDTSYDPSSTNNEEGYLYGKHSPFQDDDRAWEYVSSGDSTAHIWVSPIPFSSHPNPQSQTSMEFIRSTHSIPLRDPQISSGSIVECARRTYQVWSGVAEVSVRRGVSGRTSINKDTTALSRGNIFDDDQKSENTIPGSQVIQRTAPQARWRMLFSVMRWLSVKRKVSMEIRVTDMLKNLSVSSQDVVPSSTGHTDDNLSSPGSPTNSVISNHAQISVEPQKMSEVKLPVSSHSSSDNAPLLNSAALGLNKSNRKYLAKRNKPQRRWRI